MSLEEQMRYWATEEPDKLAREVMARWKEWRAYFAAAGFASKADKGRRYYYGLNDLLETASRLTVGGQQGEFLKVVVNQVRVLVQRSLSLLAGQAPAMAPVAANSDSAAREQAISAKGILEHVHREHDTDTLDDEVLEIAMVMGEGFRFIAWDPLAGEPVAVDETTGQPDKAGDFYNAVLTPFDVARDTSLRTRRNWPWVIIRTWESRWRLAARNPDKAAELLAAVRATPTDQDGFDLRIGTGADFLASGDMVPVYNFFHVDSDEMPGGRAFRCITDGCWLTDSPNPYPGLPLEGCTSGPVISSSLAYTNVFDALGVSDLFNTLQSIFATHAVKWGIRPIVDFADSGIQASTMGSGTTLLRVSKPELMPQPLDVPNIPKDVYEHAATIQGLLERMLGTNSTAMGQPAFAGMAASFAALMDQKAREFHDGLAKSFRSYRQGCATRELRTLKLFATDPRVAAIQGKAKAWMLKSYTRDDLRHVDRVAMEAVPPGTGTMAWKWGLLEAMAKFGVQLKPQEVIELAQSGQMESHFEHEEANTLRIAEENELLLTGKQPTVLMLSTHWLDIPEHRALLSSPSVYEKPEVVNAVLATIEEKLQAWRNMPPDMLALMGGPPPPPPPLPPAPPAPPPAPAPPNVGALFLEGMLQAPDVPLPLKMQAAEALLRAPPEAAGGPLPAPGPGAPPAPPPPAGPQPQALEGQP